MSIVQICFICFPDVNYIRWLAGRGGGCWWQCLLHYNDIVLVVTIAFYYSYYGGTEVTVKLEARKDKFALIQALDRKRGTLHKLHNICYVRKSSQILLTLISE